MGLLDLLGMGQNVRGQQGMSSLAQMAGGQQPQGMNTLQQFGGALQNIGDNWRMAGPDYERNRILKQNGGETPSNVKEYLFYNSLPPEQQQNYLRVKRAQQVLDMGGYQGVLNPTGPGLAQSFDKTLAPQDLPATREAQSRASARGTAASGIESDLNSLMANYPALQTTLKDLTTAAEGATYTPAGKALDYTREQLIGMEPRQSSLDRTDFITNVRNVVLPQLKATFGAQFTALEGDKLEETLGDPDAAPEKKVTAIQNFTQKAQNLIESKAREAQLYGIAPNGNQASQSPLNQMSPDATGGLNITLPGNQGLVLDGEIVVPDQQVVPTTQPTQAPQAVSMPPKNGVQVITTQAQFDALPKGAVYIDPDDGKQYRKP